MSAQADTEAWYGRFKNAQELTRRAMDSAKHNDAKETAALYQVEGALREVESGYGERARADANAAMQLAPNRDVQAMAGLVLAQAGDAAGAEDLAGERNNTFPAWHAGAEVLAAHDSGRHRCGEQRSEAGGYELLKEADALELGTPTIRHSGPGLCAWKSLSGARGTETWPREEFQKFIDHGAMVGNFPWGALARLGLARAYALQAQSSNADPADAARIKARAAYRDFLTLWKGADPDIPILKEAEAGHAKLNNVCFSCAAEFPHLR